MEQSKEAMEMIELMDAVDKIDINEDDKIRDPNSIGGPGTKKQNSPNNYTREECKHLLSYAMKFVKDGKAPKGFSGDFQGFLNMVGKGMEQFKKINNGNPDYQEGQMKGDMLGHSYNPNKYDKGNTGSRPGSNGKIFENLNDDKIYFYLKNPSEEINKNKNSNLKKNKNKLLPGEAGYYEDIKDIVKDLLLDLYEDGYIKYDYHLPSNDKDSGYVIPNDNKDINYIKKFLTKNKKVKLKFEQ